MAMSTGDYARWAQVLLHGMTWGEQDVILPHSLLRYANKERARAKMIEAGVIVALGTDFNPNAFCLSMVVKCLLSTKSRAVDITL